MSNMHNFDSPIRSEAAEKLHQAGLGDLPAHAAIRVVDALASDVTDVRLRLAERLTSKLAAVCIDHQKFVTEGKIALTLIEKGGVFIGPDELNLEGLVDPKDIPPIPDHFGLSFLEAKHPILAGSIAANTALVLDIREHTNRDGERVIDKVLGWKAFNLRVMANSQNLNAEQHRAMIEKFSADNPVKTDGGNVKVVPIENGMSFAVAMKWAVKELGVNPLGSNWVRTNDFDGKGHSAIVTYDGHEMRLKEFPLESAQANVGTSYEYVLDK